MRKGSIVTLLLCGFVVCGVARAQTWKLRDVDFANATGQTQFVYVPANRAFTPVVLTGDVVASGATNVLVVRLDGKVVSSSVVHNGDQFHYALPLLGAGFHRIAFSGHMPGRSEPYQPGVDCAAVSRLPFVIQSVALDYGQHATGPAQLSDLPDGLFNRAHAGRVIGNVQIVNALPGTYTAAARLVSWLASKGVTDWSSYSQATSDQVDFNIVIRPATGEHPIPSIALIEPVDSDSSDKRHHKQLSQAQDGAADTVEVPTLVVEYTLPASLEAAVNALLNVSYRKQLTASRAVIEKPVTEPAWGTLWAPDSFADHGVSDVTFHGSGRRVLALRFPTYWYVTGPVQGDIMLRSQAALPDEAHFNAWIGDTLAGSIALTNLSGDKLRRKLSLLDTEVDGADNIKLTLKANVDEPSSCHPAIPGSLWINASKSGLDVPHRTKTGAMAVVPRLIADPRIAIDGTPSKSLPALLALVAQEQSVVDGGPVPYGITFTSNADATAADTAAHAAPILTIGVDSTVLQRYAKTYHGRLNDAFMQHLAWVHVDKNDHVSIVAGNAAVFHRLSAHLGAIYFGLPDGTRDAVIGSVSGAAIIVGSDTVRDTTSADGFGGDRMRIVAIIFGLFIVFLLGFFLWKRKKGHS